MYKIILPIILTLFLPLMETRADEITGTASWYSTESCKKEGSSGIFTASGEVFDNNKLTCAMRSREWGTYYRVTNLANNKSVVVRHNDYGPNKRLSEAGRVIDLSPAAFSAIADKDLGLIKVKVSKIK